MHQDSDLSHSKEKRQPQQSRCAEFVPVFSNSNVDVNLTDLLTREPEH